MTSSNKSIRNPLGKVRGLGSAKDGTHHWWMQRVTAVALIPLSLWMLYSLLSLTQNGADYVRYWLESPAHALFLILFLGVSIYHGKLGLQVVIEDYVHTHLSKTIALLLNTYGSAVLFIMALLAVLELHFA